MFVRRGAFAAIIYFFIHGDPRRYVNKQNKMADKAAPQQSPKNNSSSEEDQNDERLPSMASFFIEFFSATFTVPDVEEAKRFLNEVQPLDDALEEQENRLIAKIAKSKEFIEEFGDAPTAKRVLEGSLLQLGAIIMARKMLNAMLLNCSKTILRSFNNPIVDVVMQMIEECQCKNCREKKSKK
jgi:hypothetical protein